MIFKYGKRNKMQVRLHKNPAFYEVDSCAGVGTFDDKNWFICVLQPSGKNGKCYKGYYAFWRFKQNYSSKELAITKCKKWLNTPLS
jgi:hypothetical protein